VIDCKAIIVLVSVAMISVLQIGCGEAKVDPMSRVLAANDSNIKRMKTCYEIFTLAKGKPPKDEKIFRDFFENDSASVGRLKRIGVEQESFGDILVSERDGQPFVVRWGAGGRDPAVIFEAEGVDGKRMVAFFKPIEIENDQFDDYFSGKMDQ